MRNVREQLGRFEQVGPVRFEASVPERGYGPVTMRPTHVPQDLAHKGKLVPQDFSRQYAGEIDALFEISHGDVPLFLVDVGIVPRESGLLTARSLLESSDRTVSASGEHMWHFENPPSSKQRGLGLSQDQFPTVRPFTFAGSALGILHKFKTEAAHWRAFFAREKNETNRLMEGALERLLSAMEGISLEEATRNQRVRSALDSLLRFDHVFHFSKGNRAAVPWTRMPAALLMDAVRGLHTGGISDPFAKREDYDRLRKWFWEVPEN